MRLSALRGENRTDKPVTHIMNRPFLPSLIAAGILLLSACGSTPVAPTAVLTLPQQQASYDAGSSIKIEGSVTGVDVKKVQVLVNNQPVIIVDQATEPGKFALSVDYPLPPNALAGSNVIQIKGLSDSDVSLVASEPVFIIVRGLPTPTTVPPKPTSIPTQAPVATVAPVAPAAPAVATTAPAAAPASVLNKDNELINVRKGPGTGYEIAGQLKQTESAAIKGKSEDGKWWQIAFANGEKGLGWVFGELVIPSGDSASAPVVKVAAPPAAPVAPVAPAPVVPVIPLATAAPAQPTVPPAALLPYSQSDSFVPRNDIGDVPLGYNGEGNASKWTWNINGATRAELEIQAETPPNQFDCPTGNLAGVSPNSAAGKRIPVTLPTGEYPFTITERGSYMFTLHIVKADGSTTFLPRRVIVGCYKRPNA